MLRKLGINYWDKHLPVAIVTAAKVRGYTTVGCDWALRLLSSAQSVCMGFNRKSWIVQYCSNVPPPPPFTSRNVTMKWVGGTNFSTVHTTLPLAMCSTSWSEQVCCWLHSHTITRMEPCIHVCVIPFICSSRVPALPSEWEVWPAQQTIQQVPQWWLIIIMLALYPGLLTCPVAFVACCGKTHHIQWCTLPSNFCAAVGWLLNPRSIAKAVLCGPLSRSVVHASRECATAPNAYLKSKYCM